MTNTNREEKAIDALYAAWGAAMQRGDVEAIGTMLTADYVLLAPGSAPLTSADIAPRLKGAFAAYEIRPTWERLELMVDGDLAVDIGWDVQHLRPLAGGEPLRSRSRVMIVLRREGGAWKYARGISQPGPAA